MLHLLYLFIVLYNARVVHSHFAAWHVGMYCLNGTDPTYDNVNNAYPTTPLFELKFKDWWFHHVDNCDQFPPPSGQFLELPANGEVTVELATNRAFTTLGTNSSRVADFGDGTNEIQLGQPDANGELPCITNPNIHTQNESMAAGTAFAISYNSDLTNVNPGNLIVFSVLYNTPWRRLATYKVPNLAACPEGGCICAWGWVANGCGEPNIYMQGFKCRVTGLTGSRALSAPKAATWCEDNQGSCVKGARQMIYWQQQEGDNIEVQGNDLSGHPRSPAYNGKLGFENGAQTDIFAEEGSATPTSVAPLGPSSTSSPSASRRILHMTKLSMVSITLFSSFLLPSW